MTPPAGVSRIVTYEGQRSSRETRRGHVNKADAIEGLERAGNTINELHTRAWATALYPTQHGWGTSIAWMAAIPVLSVASVGHLIGSAVVEQLPTSMFEQLRDFGRPK